MGTIVMSYETLSELAGADEFFSQLESSVPAPIVGMARRHALRRLRHNLPRQGLKGLADAALRELCRKHLQQAYAEFIAWTPLEISTHAPTDPLSSSNLLLN